MKLLTGMCEPLLLDAVAPELHQNHRMVVVTWRTSKNHRTVKIGGGRWEGGAIAWKWCLPGTIWHL